MRVQVLQHVPFEGIGSIQAWMDAQGLPVRMTRLFAGDPLPRLSDFDWLIVMGGPMSVNDEQAYAWLRPEKTLIAEAVSAGRIALGICLGAQLIASALGVRVYPNGRKEIGWFPVERIEGAAPRAADLFSGRVEVFHWHGETFDLPRGAVPFLRSEVCANQAFALGNSVIGLQFHLEVTPASAALMIENGADEIVPGPTVQTAQEMLRRPDRFVAANALMDRLLDTIANQAEPTSSRRT